MTASPNRYAVMMRRHLYAGPSNVDRDLARAARMWHIFYDHLTRDEARRMVAESDARPHYLAHNEAARPELRVVTMTSRDYIAASLAGREWFPVGSTPGVR